MRKSNARRPSVLFLILATLMILTFVGGLVAIVVTALNRG